MSNYIPQLHEAPSPEIEQTTKKFLSEQRAKKIRNEIQEIFDEENYAFEEYAEEFLANVAASRAEQFIEKVLKGDEDAAGSLVGPESRYKAYGHDAGESWASMIWGKLSVTGAVELRAKLVAAHPELLVSERVKDLESIVDGLTRQIKEKDKEIERLRDTWRP